jgi:hypothetical protein
MFPARFKVRQDVSGALQGATRCFRRASRCDKMIPA